MLHVFFEFYDNDDQSYLGLAYSSSDCYATLYGLEAKSNIKLKVTYAYSYPVYYNGRYQYQVGHGTYDIYVNVIGHTMPTAIKLTPEKNILKVGETFRIKTSLTPAGTNCHLNWGVALGMAHKVEFLNWENRMEKLNYSDPDLITLHYLFLKDITKEIDHFKKETLPQVLRCYQYRYQHQLHHLHLHQKQLHQIHQYLLLS